MSKAFELAKTVLQSEEIARLSKPVAIITKDKNNIYSNVDIPLSIEHDCYSIDIPAFFDSVNFVKFAPSQSEYSYRINHGKWVSMSKNSNAVEKEFDIESIDISNVVGSGILNIYLEGKKCL
jgi:hypothetical protein